MKTPYKTAAKLTDHSTARKGNRHTRPVLYRKIQQTGGNTKINEYTHYVCNGGDQRAAGGCRIPAQLVEQERQAHANQAAHYNNDKHTEGDHLSDFQTSSP